MGMDKEGANEVAIIAQALYATGQQIRSGPGHSIVIPVSDNLYG